jgi:hypothetical protein
MPFQLGNQHGKNATGRKPSAFSGFSDRASHYLEKLSKAEILALASNDEALEKISSFDCLVVMQLAAALDRNDKLNLAAERERLYDRVIGKPKQSVDIAHSGAIAQVSVDLSATLKFLANAAATGGQGAIQGDDSVGLVLPSSVCPE